MAIQDNSAPAAWVKRFAGLVPCGGPVLDLAAGKGRHTRMFRDMGHRVTAIDRNIGQLGPLAADADVEAIAADLEDGSPWPLGNRRFAGVIVVNYLCRPLLEHLIDAVAPEGVLIYETFSAGNEAYGRPRNADFLLRPGELLALCRGRLAVVAYECGVVDGPAVKQRICALRSGQLASLSGEAKPGV